MKAEQRHTLFWIGLAILVLLAISVLSEVLMPFILGLALAYMLDPLVSLLQRRLGIPRLIGAALVVTAITLIGLLVIALLSPLIISQLSDLVAAIPGYIASARDYILARTDPAFVDWLNRNELGLDSAMKDLAKQSTGLVGNFISSIWKGSLALFNLFALLIVTPVVTFYLLKDWDRMVAAVDRWIPRNDVNTVRGLADEMNEVISGFLRGQLTVLILLGLFYMAGLTLIGLNFGVLIGLVAGLLSFVPYLGALVGFVLSMAVAIAQFWPDWTWIAVTMGVFFAGQVLEGNFLSPLIIGDRVRLHPVWLIFALFVFAYLFGFLGMLIAVPVTAAIGVLVRYGIRQYMQSDIYRNEDPGRLEDAPKRLEAGPK